MALVLSYPNALFAQATPLSREFYYGSITHLAEERSGVFKDVTYYYEGFDENDPMSGTRRILTSGAPTVEEPTMLPVAHDVTIQSGDAKSTARLSATPVFSSGTTIEQLQFVALAEAIPGGRSSGLLEPKAQTYFNNSFFFEVGSSPVLMLLTGTLEADVNSGSGVELPGHFSLRLDRGDSDRASSAAVNEPIYLESGSYFLEVFVAAGDPFPQGSAAPSALATANVTAAFMEGYVAWKEASDGVFSAGSQWAGGTPPSRASATRHSALFAFGDAYTVTWDGNVNLENALVTGMDVTFDLSGGTDSLLGQSGLEVSGLGTEAKLTIENGTLDVDMNGEGRASVGSKGEKQARLVIPDGSLAPGGSDRGNRLRANVLEVGPNGRVDIENELIVGDTTSLPQPQVSARVKKSALVTGGGKLVVGELFVAGDTTAGLLEVTGAGSEVSVIGILEADVIPFMFVGAGGNGTIRVSDGGTLLSGGSPVITVVGNNPGVSALIEVSGSSSGAPSTFNITADLSIGRFGTGELSVTNGALARIDPDFVPQIMVGVSRANPAAEIDAAHGILRISGEGSNLDATVGTGNVIGVEGIGQLIVLHGGEARFGNVVFGLMADGAGAGLIGGAGSIVHAGEMSIGVEGAGRLAILEGAELRGDLAGPLTGLLTISAAGGRGELEVINSSAKEFLVVEVGGNGSVLLQNSEMQGQLLNVAAGGLFKLDDGIARFEGANVDGLICGSGVFDVVQEANSMGVVNVQRGTLCPGTSPGTLTIAGNLVVAAEGTIEIEIGGTQPGTQHDVLHVTGEANLGGVLRLVFIDSFTPRAGDSFEFLLADGEAGYQFEAVEVQGLEPGWQFELGESHGTGATLLSLSDGEAMSPVQPDFTLHPASASIIASNSVTFTASATGFPAPTYQWRKDGADIIGATSTSYTINDVQPADEGEYSVVATNSAGFATSNPATLSVVHFATSTLRFPEYHANGQLSFTVDGVSGANYVVQSSTNLVDWSSILTNSAPFTFTHSVKSDAPHRFFRVAY